jgi:hypothetical protein
MTTEQTGRIRVVRPATGGSPDRERAFAIEVDDVVVGAVAHGADTVVDDVAAGARRVRLTADRGRASPTREVTVEPGTEAVLGCRSRPLGVHLLFAFLARGRYISWI